MKTRSKPNENNDYKLEC